MTSTEPGVPLRLYRRHPGVGVLLICEGCQKHMRVELETLITELVARGLGDAQTGVREVAAMLKRPCKRCGARKWETRPAFPGGPEAGNAAMFGQPKGYLDG